VGILGQNAVDFTQVPAIMLLEEEDVKLLGKVQEIVATTEAKMNMEIANASTTGMRPRFCE
jgi:hypothetical protein